MIGFGSRRTPGCITFASAMIEVVTRRTPLLTQKEVWYFDGSPVQLAGRTFFYQALEKPNQTHDVFRTLWSELDVTEETLFSRISETFRYHIRKADRIDHSRWFQFHPDANSIQTFLDTHCVFAATKSILPFSKSRLAAMVSAGCFCLTGVDVGEETVIFHSYLTDGVSARLLSSHHAGNQPDATRGYLNKSLHWHDMLFFKKNGYRIYDWGGVSEPGQGRTFFKESFGGKPHLSYNYIVENKLYRAISHLRP
jgi:hypothetical protein